MISIKIPDRFLRKTDDPEEGFITSKRLNHEFKMLEYRIKKIEVTVFIFVLLYSLYSLFK